MTNHPLYQQLPTVSQEQLQGKPIGGQWRVRAGALEGQRFGGAWHPVHKGQRGPGNVLLVGGMILVQER